MTIRARFVSVVFYVVVSSGTLGCSADGKSADQEPIDESALAGDGGDGGPSAGAKLPLEIQWFRNSAEYQVMTRVTYRAAAQALDAQLLLRKDTSAWGVVLDIDETTLDNSTYQKERALQGLGFSPDSWNEWVNRKAAPAVPGAKEFVSHVRAVGGKVVFVTNRDQPGCAPTEQNLRAVGMVYDAILCTPEASKTDKNPRFKAVREGTAIAGVPAIDVLAFVGDNIQDFPDTDQSLRLGPEEKFAVFGTKFFVLPNPMYGSFAKNPPN